MSKDISDMTGCGSVRLGWAWFGRVSCGKVRFGKVTLIKGGETNAEKNF